MMSAYRLGVLFYVIAGFSTGCTAYVEETNKDLANKVESKKSAEDSNESKEVAESGLTKEEFYKKYRRNILHDFAERYSELTEKELEEARVLVETKPELLKQIANGPKRGGTPMYLLVYTMPTKARAELLSTETHEEFKAWLAQNCALCGIYSEGMKKMEKYRFYDPFGAFDALEAGEDPSQVAKKYATGVIYNGLDFHLINAIATGPQKRYDEAHTFYIDDIGRYPHQDDEIISFLKKKHETPEILDRLRPFACWYLTGNRSYNRTYGAYSIYHDWTDRVHRMISRGSGPAIVWMIKNCPLWARDLKDEKDRIYYEVLRIVKQPDFYNTQSVGRTYNDAGPITPENLAKVLLALEEAGIISIEEMGMRFFSIEYSDSSDTFMEALELVPNLDPILIRSIGDWKRRSRLYRAYKWPNVTESNFTYQEPTIQYSRGSKTIKGWLERWYEPGQAPDFNRKTPRTYVFLQEHFNKHHPFGESIIWLSQNYYSSKLRGDEKYASLLKEKGIPVCRVRPIRDGEIDQEKLEKLPKITDRVDFHPALPQAKIPESHQFYDKVMGQARYRFQEAIENNHWGRKDRVKLESYTTPQYIGKFTDAEKPEWESLTRHYVVQCYLIVK